MNLCLQSQDISHTTIKYIICYFCRLEFEPPLSAVTPNPTSFKILHGILSQKTCMFCIEWTKTLWDCFPREKKGCFVAIQAFLVFFYKWTQKHHWSIRAQSLNLSLGTLVLSVYLPTLTPVGWKLRSHTGSRLWANFSRLIEKCELLPSCLTQFPKIC